MLFTFLFYTVSESDVTRDLKVR